MRTHLERTRDVSPTTPGKTLASLIADSHAETHEALEHVEDRPAPDDDVLDVVGVARMVHVGRNKIYEMVARNQIPHRRFGRCIRFSRAVVMQWLNSCSLQDAKERQ